MNYALALIHTKPQDRAKNPHNEHEIDISVDLSHEEYTQGAEAIQVLYDFSCQARFLTVVALNYRDYFNAVDTRIPLYIREADDDKQRPIDMEAINLELNRLLINYISSVTHYLKRTEVYIKKKHGDISVKRFNTRRHELYDSSFSYRFVYFLRNYAQHAGLPIDSVELTSTFNPDESAPITHSLHIGILRDSLLNNYDYSGAKDNSLKKEIEQQPVKIELRPHLIEMMKAVSHLNSQFIQDEFATLKPSATYLKSLLDRLPSYADANPSLLEFEIVRCDTALDGSNTIRNGRITEIPVDAIKLLLATHPDSY